MYDLIIKGGTIVDGTLSKAYQADVCVQDGLIVAIVPDAGEAHQILDARGKIVAPGFIDIHSHSDSAPFKPYLCDSKLQQGVTTEITGNCGSSMVPANSERAVKVGERVLLSVSDYVAAVNEKGHIGNTGMLIGHGFLRASVMGHDNRVPTEKEMQELEALLDRELERGAFGMSLGLIYPPSAFSEREELVRLAKVVARHDAVVSIHMRNEGLLIFEAVDEILSIAEESGCKLEISHLKLVGKPQWGRAEELIHKIRAARAAGIRVRCDQYPYCASSTSLTAMLPHWAHEGGRSKMMKRLQSPTEELKDGICLKVEERGGMDTILITRSEKYPEYAARYLGEIGRELGLDTADTVIRVLSDCGGSANCIFFCINEQDVLTIMPELFISVVSDGYAISLDPKITKEIPHPRNFGTFPTYFQTVRENALLPIEDAVYKCTGLPAEAMGIVNRGLLKLGYYADITVFDWNKIGSKGNYIESRVKPEGVEYVVVNGKLALDHGTVVCADAGQALVRG